ncbi:MAG TPA: hypothetical protein PKZ22_15165 [Accumulibacter sp.]|jgi:hypothetical protein|nr:hypothetical protein [Accumulibacter sp.]
MGLRQTFQFAAQSETLVEEFLRELGAVADLDEERESFLFRNKDGEPPFEFHCIIVRGGIDAHRSGEYFKFLGMFIEGLTGEFGSVMVEDA